MGLISVGEAARRLGVSRAAIYKRLKRGTLKGNRSCRTVTFWSVDEAAVREEMRRKRGKGG